MRRILCATVAAIWTLPLVVRADEPRRGIIGRGREIVQACWDKCCDKPSRCRASCGPCNPCGEDDVRVGQLIDTLFYAERACDRKRAALRLDAYNWTQHPEIVAALTYTMQSDCDRNVRIAAADSLKDMRVSDYDSIGAMQFTREADPSCRVRYKAKWGIIKGEKSRPPMLTYVSGYGTAVPCAEQSPPAPRLNPTPTKSSAPEPPASQMNPTEDQIPEPVEMNREARRGVRRMISSAMAKVRSRS